MTHVRLCLSILLQRPIESSYAGAPPVNDADDLVLPGGLGELGDGGMGTTLRWRKKFQYAHGFPGQDGPHWLGGYADITAPPIHGADSMSGKGLSRVNVYDWGVNKQVIR
jgi:hypothetical protein